MGAIGITEHDVHRAADILFAKNNTPPKNKDVLEHLGTGSSTTITKYMQTWRDKNGLRLGSQRHQAIIAKTMASLMENIDAQLREEYDHRINELTSVNQSQSEDIERLSAIETRHKSTIDLREKEIADLTHRMALMEETNRQITAELRDRNSQVEQLSIITTERERTIERFKELGAEWKHEREKMFESSTVDARRIESLAERNRMLHERVKELSSELEATGQKHQQLEATILALRERIDTLDTKKQEVELFLATTKETHHNIVTELRDKISELRTENARLTTERSVLHRDAESAERTLSELRARIKRLEDHDERDVVLLEALRKLESSGEKTDPGAKE